MKATKPMVYVQYFNGHNERGRCFESFEAAERFMDWIESNHWEILKVELI